MSIWRSQRIQEKWVVALIGVKKLERNEIIQQNIPGAGGANPFLGEDPSREVKVVPHDNPARFRISLILNEPTRAWHRMSYA